MAKSTTRIVLTTLLVLILTIAKPITSQNCGCAPDFCCSQYGYCGTTDEYCGDGCREGPCKGASGGGNSGDPAVSLEETVTPEFFNSILNQARDSCAGKGFYSHNAFMAAASWYQSFGGSISKREIAAFFAHVTHETEYSRINKCVHLDTLEIVEREEYTLLSKATNTMDNYCVTRACNDAYEWDSANRTVLDTSLNSGPNWRAESRVWCPPPKKIIKCNYDGIFTKVMCYIEEIDGPAKAASGEFCDKENTDFPCAPGKGYYGRGPIQLSWNYNYGLCGRDLNENLLASPEKVAQDPALAFKTAFWFWTTNVRQNFNQGFGATIRAINGMECGGRNPETVAKRIEYFKDYCGKLGVEPGENLSC